MTLSTFDYMKLKHQLWLKSGPCCVFYGSSRRNLKEPWLDLSAHSIIWALSERKKLCGGLFTCCYLLCSCQKRDFKINVRQLEKHHCFHWNVWHVCDLKCIILKGPSLQVRLNQRLWLVFDTLATCINSW